MIFLSYLIAIFFTLSSSASEIRDPCACYPLGTRKSIDQISICDATQTCKCEKNVEGKNCSHCKQGFYGILSGKGCMPCKCDKYGSLATCSPEDGQCKCKEGFEGFRCDKCKPDHYRSDKTTCRPCNCNISGSKSLQCDLKGMCDCKANVVGKKCNQCSKNTYNFEQGCIPCSLCYNIVDEKAVALNKTIWDTWASIKKLQDYFTNQLVLNLTNENLNFQAELQSLKEKVENLHFSLTIEKPLDSNINIPVSIELITNLIETSINSIKTNYDPQTYEKNFEELKKHMDDLKSQIFKWSTVLKEIQDNKDSHENASQQLKLLYRNATKIADDYEKNEKLLSKTVLHVTDICESACTLNKNISDQLDNQIQTMKNIIDNITKLPNISDRPNVLLDKINDIESNTLTILNSLDSIEIPKIQQDNVSKMNKKLSDIKDNLALKQIKNNGIELSVTNGNEMLEDIMSKNADIKNHKGTLLKLEERIDNSLMAIEKYIQYGRDVVNAYGSDISHAKNNAAEKMSEVSGIHQILDNVRDKIADVNLKLNDVKDDLNEYDNHMKNITNILTDIKTGNQNAARLQDDIKALIKEVHLYQSSDKADMENLIKRIEIKTVEAQEERKLLDGLRENLDDSKKALTLFSQDAINVYNRLLREVNELISFMKIFPFSEKELNEIEGEIEMVENNLRNIRQLSSQYKELQREEKVVRALAESLQDLGKKNYCTSGGEEKPTT